MSLIEIKTICDALEVNNSITKDGGQFIFRGVSCETYPLLPRIEWDGSADKADEQKNFNDFKKSLEDQGYFKQDFMHNDFRTLGLAQHYERFPTRLLDWTTHILIALYFACRNTDKHDLNGAIWLFRLPMDSSDSIWLTSKEENEASPFNLNQFKIFICGSFVDDFNMLLPKENRQGIFGNSRDGKQRSVMTLHPKKKSGVFGNLEDLNQKYSLKKILVPREHKQTILNVLSGDPWRITHETLFNGVSARELQSQEIWKNIMVKNLRAFSVS